MTRMGTKTMHRTRSVMAFMIEGAKMTTTRPVATKSKVCLKKLLRHNNQVAVIAVTAVMRKKMEGRPMW